VDVASGFAFGYDPTGRSVIIEMERTPLDLLKSTEYLNFRHFRHFAILGISASSIILILKYILPQYAQNSFITT